MQNNIFFDLIILVVGLVVYYITKNIFYATGICIVATWLQVVYCYWKYRFISKGTWLNAILTTVFGYFSVK